MSRIRTLLLSALTVVSMTAGAVTPHKVSVESSRVTEDFNSMWNASETEMPLTLPEGWAVDRNLDAPRKVGKWADASAEVMYAGGASLASNAKNGTWNFGSSSDSHDRAIGGLTTTVSNGTRGVSVMTALTNGADIPLDRMQISYNIEKYRKGANASGFAVQLYYSTDGENWTDAGDSFHVFFAPDSETIGEEIVPISSSEVLDKWLLVDIMPGDTLYLAWNISVASGSTPDKAQGLAIDDINIEAYFASSKTSYLYIEDALGSKNLSVYSPDNDSFGAAPGIPAELSKVTNGVSYKAWTLSSSDKFDIMVFADGINFGPVTIDGGIDNYFCLSPAGLDPIADPLTYTGWVDPDRKPFVSSGIYLRGEVNSWGADSDWEFSNEGNNVYVLYDKSLNGQFKVADANWSSSCNYGSNGSNILIDTPYVMTAGTDGNISCGAYVFECKRIVLTIVEGVATLLLESDDDDSNLTSVYVYGDFNSWNFMSTTGELKLDESDNLFKGQISMKAGADGLSHWRIYQRPGMVGGWGLAEDTEKPALSGFLIKGSAGNAAVEPGTYNFAFSLEDGAYTLTAIESAPSVMTLNPATVVLTPENPASVKVLSLNNSLIHYNDQDFVFNDIANSMGVDASWTKHTNLGKPLSYHWNEGDGLAEDGTPGAKMMIRSEAWSHIILQEQSSLPRTEPETFRKNVSQWMEYIRQYCPNPNATVILPVNWAYSSDLDNFQSYNSRFLEVYTEIASELGAVVVPVAAAYDNAYTSAGSEELLTWFSDDRHPTPKATYMAACMEFGAIMGIDPLEITHIPEGMTADEALNMRRFASEALKGYSNTISHLDGTILFKAHVYDDFGIELPAEGVVYTVDGGGTISPDGLFKSDGTRGEFTVTAKWNGFERKASVIVTDHGTEVPSYPAISLNADKLSASEDFDSMGSDATATLPEEWRIDRQTVGTRTLGTFATALSQTTYSGGESLPSNAKNGVWNFGAEGDSDRAPGGITTGVDNGTRAINLYTHLVNDGKKSIAKLNVAYDIEKYRKGNNEAGFAVQMYYSFDGRNWQNAGTDFYTYLAPDAATEGYAEVPGEVIPVEGVLPIEFGAGIDIFLAWNISVASGDAAQGAMALAIDNVRFEGELPVVPQTKHCIYVDNRTTWDALGLYAWGDSELFGAWPGQAPIDELEKDGIVYTVFGLDADGGNFNLIFNNWNNNKQLPDYNITADRDYWFIIDDSSVKEISVTGVNNVEENFDDLFFNGWKLTSSSESQISIFTTDGRLVLKSMGPEMNVDILPKGLYIALANKACKKIAVR